MNTPDLTVSFQKKYYKIHGNTNEYSTMHMNLQCNPHLKISQKYSFRKILNLQEYTGIHMNTLDFWDMRL